jgi:2,3-bisphosphoglycerate-dependent phosphoglycerate mutase
VRARLILLRHGESEWNADDVFAGWIDVDLTGRGRAEAARAGRLIRDAGVLPDAVHTSLLRRAITSAHLALAAADRLWIPVRRSWRLNERHYGALQGRSKKEILAEFGEEQFALWRRSFHVPPPPVDDETARAQAALPQYAGLGELIPRTECLKDVIARLLPYWETDVCADLRDGKTVLLTAHGTSLRALMKHLDQISDADIAALNIPTGIPLLYELDDEMRPVTPGGRYLDVTAAADGAAAVANQGRG